MNALMESRDGRKQVLFDEPYLWPFEGAKMKFKLTYEGPLPSTQGAARNGQNDPRAPAKHKIRQRFHAQLRRLWEINQNLTKPSVYEQVLMASGDAIPPTPNSLAKKFTMYGWNFVPLVTEDLGVTCALDILLLRPTPKQKDSWFGDIDNRLKTLVDALQLPSANEKYVDHLPDPAESPFYCLLENDKLLTRLALETDEMLEPIGSAIAEGDVRLLISVEVRPLFISVVNLAFA